MKRIRYSSLVCSALMVVALAGAAFATPAPNSAYISLYTFDNCANSTVTVTNNYPALISIEDVMHPSCVGFANLHGWSFSEDGGATASLYKNGSNFIYCASVKIEGPGEGEGGLRFSPWWSQYADGRFMINATSGEIACFSGRLPFYSFTGAFALSYIKGTTVFMQITYTANGLSSASPATIQYRYVDGSGTYDSPVIPYDEGNPNEDPPHGRWGCLHDAVVGGYFQPRANTGVGLKATWSNICHTVTDVVPTLPSTWGRMKTLYR